MTDRELLELAARAAGMELDYTIRLDGKAFYHSERNAFALADGGWFAPLTDDGDAFRLSVKLRIRVQPATDDQYALANVVGSEEGVAEGCIFDGDPYSATRRAIVRAAAEIGKDMK